MMTVSQLLCEKIFVDAIICGCSSSLIAESIGDYFLFSGLVGGTPVAKTINFCTYTVILDAIYRNGIQLFIFVQL